MDDAIDKRYETKTERPLDPCFVETEQYDPVDNKKIHLIRASRPIVLTQDDANATLENTVVAAKGEHLRVYGDRVRVAGRIELRGLNVSIHCRELEFVPNSKGNPEIDVTGEDGAEPDQGVNEKAPQQAAGGTEEDRKGRDGTPGAPGGDPGKSGKQGGSISIACHTMIPLAPVALVANGGKGGAGARGQDGGQGGNGLNNAGTDYDYSGRAARASIGGPGGTGGNGADGGQGGKGGTIELHCLDLWPSSEAVNLSVAGGDGGRGGDAGHGGQGGNGGKPAAGALQKDGFDYRLADGADSGDGGAPGVAGWGGGCGNPGTITIRTGTAEALRYPANKLLQKQTASIRLTCKSGAIGKRGNPAEWGKAGEPGQPADEGSPRPFLGAPVGGAGGHKKGKSGTAPDPNNRDLRRAPTRTRPTVQNPLQRKWEVWEGEIEPPQLPPPPPEPKPLTQRLPPGIDALRKRDPKAAQLLIQRITAQWQAEKQAWNEVIRKYNLEHPVVAVLKADVVLNECWADKVKLWDLVKLEDIGAKQDAEQLQMLHDYVRTRCLLAPNGQPLAVPRLPEQVAWLTDASHGKLDRKKEGEKEIVLNTPVAMYRLWLAASSTYGNIWRENNIFGHDSKYAVLGDLDTHVKALQDMRDNLKDIETLYDQTVRFHNMATNWAATWGQVKNESAGVVRAMERAINDSEDGIKKRLGDGIRAIEQKERLLKEVYNRLDHDVTAFKVEIDSKVGLSAQDFFGMLNQLSFTNRELTHPEQRDKKGKLIAPEKFLWGGALATGAMAISQAGELMAKAMDNVITDDGQPVNKKYIIRSVRAMSAKLPTMTELKQERDGMISRDLNSEVRLLATVEQFNSILENFYEQSKNARQISHTLDAYVEAVQQRNAKVDEWNQLLALYAYCKAESKKAEEQSSAVDKTKSNDPGLVAMARFSTSLNRHALEEYVKRLYEAGTVCTLHTLRKFDAFHSLSEIGSESGADIGFLNSKILAQAINDFIGATLDATKTKSDRSMMDPGVEFELTPEGNPLLFDLLRNGQAWTFLVPAPNARAILPAAEPPRDPESPTPERNEFALKCDVRLTHIVPSVFLDGGKPLSSLCSEYTIQLTHSGMETFCRPDGEEVRLDHEPMTKSFKYKEGAIKDTGQLSNEHSRLIGPFCQWEIRIPEGGIVYKPEVTQQDKNLNKLKSIKIEFKGTYRDFDPVAVDEAMKDAKAEPEDVADDTFEQIVLKSNKPIIVDFEAAEDATSSALEPMRKEVKQNHTGKVRFAKMNTAENKQTYERYKEKVTKLPSLVVFSRGDLLMVVEGAEKDIPATLRKFVGQPSADGKSLGPG